VDFDRARSDYFLCTIETRYRPIKLEPSPTMDASCVGETTDGPDFYRPVGAIFCTVQMN
jgi:hypothetical protein